MNKHDICLLNETWRAEDSKISLPGFWDFSVIKPKRTKRGRPSGGLTIFCKEDLRKGVKIDSFGEWYIWLRLDSKFFDLPNTLYIGAFYLTPEYGNKSTYKVDYFEEITASIAKYLRKGNIILGGDFNARTGSEDTSYSIEIPGFNGFGVEEGSSFDCRLSCDEKVNNYGKKLNSLCNSQNLVIANGRVIGDRIGNFTCQNSHGSSVVDYFIADRDFYNRLKILVIHEPVFGSIHSPLSLSIVCSVKIAKIKSPPLPKPPRFICDPSKRDQFIDVLKEKQVGLNALHN